MPNKATISSTSSSKHSIGNDTFRSKAYILLHLILGLFVLIVLEGCTQNEKPSMIPDSCELFVGESIDFKFQIKDGYLKGDDEVVWLVNTEEKSRSQSLFYQYEPKTPGEDLIEVHIDTGREIKNHDYLTCVINTPTLLTQTLSGDSLELVPSLTTTYSVSSTLSPTSVSTTLALDVVCKIFLAIATEEGKLPSYEADIWVFSANGQVIKTDRTAKSFVEIDVPCGKYDVFVVYQGKPPIMFLRKDALVMPGEEIYWMRVRVPNEHTLLTKLITKNGSPALSNYTDRVLLLETEISRATGIGSNSHILNISNPYTVSVQYAPNYAKEELVSTNVWLSKDEVTEIVFRLPFDEGRIRVKVVSEDGALSGYAKVVVTEVGTDKTLTSWSMSSTATINVKAEVDYKVSIEYSDKVVDEVVQVGAGQTYEIVFEYP